MKRISTGRRKRRPSETYFLYKFNRTEDDPRNHQHSRI